MTAEPVTYRGLFAQPRFMQLWAGQTASLIGDAAARVAVPVLAVALTGNPAILGLLFAAQALPWLVVSPFAGLLADVADRRRILRIALVAEALTIAAMAFASQAWQLVVLMFVAGCLQVLQTPARTGALPALLGGYLPLGIGLVAATIQITDVAGQAITGLLLAEMSARTILCANALTFLIFALAVPQLPNATGQDTKAATEPFVRRLSAGLRHLSSTPALRRYVAVMVARGATVTAALALLYALVTERDAGPLGFGLTSAAFTAALVAGSLATGRVTARHHPDRVLWASTLLAAVCLLPMWLPLPLPAAAAILVIAGLLLAPGNVIANSEISRQAHESVRGQVIAAAWALIKTGQVIGGLLAATLVGPLGAGPTIALAAALLATVMAVLPQRALTNPTADQ